MEPARETVLIGAIVLEELDFLIDFDRHKLVPRDPEKIVAEVESVATMNLGPASQFNGLRRVPVSPLA